MKIAILTFTDGTNIGQRLQNYALQQSIMSFDDNYNVYTIRQGYPFSTRKRKIKKGITFLKHPLDGIQKAKRQKKFDEFNRKYINFYPEEFPFYGDNSRFADKFDCFIVGSDQIWNPNSPFVGNNFFLTFARKEQRMTYAPSFSVDMIPVEKQKQYKNYLDGFPVITVREDKGAELVKDITGKDAEVVIDPTLLMKREDYDKIMVISSIKPNGRYILSMFLGAYPENDVKKVSAEFGIQVFCLDCNAAIGPDEFLNFIEQAELVLTDSYHITIFSILYHRPFINFMRSGKGKEMSSRFETLYRLLRIKNRTWEYLQKNMNEIFIMRYTDIESNIARERERCRRILKEEFDSI